MKARSLVPWERAQLPSILELEEQECMGFLMSFSFRRLLGILKKASVKMRENKVWRFIPAS